MPTATVSLAFQALVINALDGHGTFHHPSDSPGGDIERGKRTIRRMMPIGRSRYGGLIAYREILEPALPI
jgi:hypothetical protein